jgi:hypothetical protein
MSGPKLVGRNTAGNLYGLTTLCPIVIGTPPDEDRSYESCLRATLAALPDHKDSFFAAVPNTYLARFYILKDVFYESRPARKEHLKSQYLVFSSDFHGGLHDYLHGLWHHGESDVRAIWQHCVAFSEVSDADSFIAYIERCQLTNNVLFNGSTDQPLAEQLKGLYLKQRFGAFVAEHQGFEPAALKRAFTEFVESVRIDDLSAPTWRPGASTLDSVEIN